VVLAIEPFSHAEAAFDAPLWQAMPFVKAGRFGSIPPVWTYGGALSVGYLGDAIADAMLEMAS
jgi:iron complex transport system substrate-binding protein